MKKFTESSLGILIISVIPAFVVYWSVITINMEWFSEHLSNFFTEQAKHNKLMDDNFQQTVFKSLRNLSQKVNVGYKEIKMPDIVKYDIDRKVVDHNEKVVKIITTLNKLVKINS